MVYEANLVAYIPFYLHILYSWTYYKQENLW